MNRFDNHPRFDKSSDQYQLSMLRKLHGWLSRHPKPNDLIKDEVNALNWALSRLDENHQPMNQERKDEIAADSEADAEPAETQED